MRCAVCKCIFLDNVSNLCFTCNKVICTPCNLANTGKCDSRFFILDGVRLCYSCFCSKKYKNYSI